MAEPTRERIGNYELLGVIGDGAQGRVYKARRVAGPGTQGEVVAIKLLRVAGAGDDRVERFHRDGELLRSLDHPGIVRYEDAFTWNAGEWDESLGVVMEYLEGETLDKRIEAHPAGIPWNAVRPLFERALEALVYARSRGVIHRDLKPSNLFLTRDGGVKVIDFDIARNEDNAQMSTVGWKGTFDYMAPDFIRENGFRGDEPSDVFSMGICLHHALTGQLPFPALGQMAQVGYLNRWRGDNPPAVPCEHGAYSALVGARETVRRATAVQRAERFATFAELLERLRAVEPRVLEHSGRATYAFDRWVETTPLHELFEGRRRGDNLAVRICQLRVGAQARDFIRGMRVLLKYPYPGIVRHRDFVAVRASRGPGTWFVVTEAAGPPGETTLAAILRDGHPLRLDQTLLLFAQYCTALQYLHEDPRPIAHAGIRLDTLLAAPGDPMQGRLGSLAVALADSRTLAGSAPGLLDFAAPELAGSAERGPPGADIYALALCLYHAVTGRAPFPPLPHDIEQAWAALQARLETPPALPLALPVFQRLPRLGQVLEQALAAQPERRHASAGALRADLEGLLREVKDTGLALDEPNDDDLDAATMAVPTGPGAVPDARDNATAAVDPGRDWILVRRRDYRRSQALVAAAVVAVAGGLALAGYGLHHWRTAAGPADARGGLTAGARPALAPDAQAEAAARARAAIAHAAALGEPVADAAFVRRAATALDTIAAAATTQAGVDAAAAEARDAIARDCARVAELFDAAVTEALARDETASVTTHIAAWKDLAGHAALMGLTADAHAAQAERWTRALHGQRVQRTADALLHKLPPTLATPAALAAAAQTAADLDVLVASVDVQLPDPATAAVDAVRARLGELTAAHVETLRRAAADLVAGDADANAAIAAIEALPQQTPRLFRSHAVAIVAAAGELRTAAAGRAAFAKRLADWSASAETPPRSARDWSALEDLARSLDKVDAAAWPGVSADELAARTGAIGLKLDAGVAAAVGALRDAAVQAYTTRDGEPERASLQDVAKLAPTLLARQGKAYDSAREAVEAARTDWVRRSRVAAKPKPPTPVAKEPEPTPPPEPPAPPAPVAIVLDPDEQAFLDAITAGRPTVTARLGSQLNIAQANAVLTALQPIRTGLRWQEFTLSRRATDLFVAQVAEAWTGIQALDERLHEPAEGRAWAITRDALAALGRDMQRGAIQRYTPEQKAETRWQFLLLLGRVEAMTRRMGAIPPGDPLRRAVEDMLSEEQDAGALLAARVRATEGLGIGWLMATTQ